jgi:mannan endo-1,6-alpha-mannosidase
MFWGLAAMTAAEVNFPEQSGQPSWLALAQGVFNTVVARWDDTSCNGGMRWQIYPYQSGYTVKNAISNGGLMQLGARLVRYTGNQTYTDWVDKLWDWSASTPILTTNSTPWHINDLVTIDSDCKSSSGIQYTYNYGAYLAGAAYMYNSVSRVAYYFTEY